MAGILMPNVGFALAGTTSVQVVDPLPAGKAESLCLMAALGAGITVDNYIQVVMGAPATTGTMLLYNEPVRFQQPGGNPVLLMNFILSPGQWLVCQGSVVAASMWATVFNRWRFDA